MPQFRRKVPFSGKAKKEQLKLKKKATCSKGNDNGQRNDNEYLAIRNIQYHPKYALKFYQDSQQSINERKKLAEKAIHKVSEASLEIDGIEYFPSDLEFPKRPRWDFNLTREQLERNENRYFSEYLSKIEEKLINQPLSYFELNLETWRQLWRVIEMSDILLFIVDVRFASLMFPPSMYTYITKTLKKSLILVFNKIDLVASSLVVAWMSYFRQHYPDIHIVLFTTYPVYNLRNAGSEKQSKRKKSKPKMAAEGAMNLFETCQSIVGDDVNLDSWRCKIQEEMDHVFEMDDLLVEENHQFPEESEWCQHEKYKNNVLTIGCMGNPNVGKSSLINALMGKKVVSISKTPGHTKHFQTIFLTKNVKLCDCPGLVFPSLVPRPVQILMGSFPIAQVREPYSVVQYLGERLNLPAILHLQHPSDDKSAEWSAIDICEAWALKRGFLTARTARPDIYRAANHLLRLALEGKINIYFRPEGYFENINHFESHSDIELVKWIQTKVADRVKIESVQNPTFSSTCSSNRSSSVNDSDSDDNEVTIAHKNKFEISD